MKVIIAGGRDFDNSNLLTERMDHYLSKLDDNIEIVSGCANGADSIGEIYANNRGYRLKKFPADWNKFGKGAGFKRNVEMAKYADALIAFWDGSSRGTNHMINIAKKERLQIKIVKYKN